MFYIPCSQTMVLVVTVCTTAAFHRHHKGKPALYSWEHYVLTECGGLKRVSLRRAAQDRFSRESRLMTRIVSTKQV